MTNEMDVGKTALGDRASENEGRILIIGKTGNGKSTLGNLLLGKTVFDVAPGMSSTTRDARIGHTSLGHDRMLKVVDTPDITSQQIPDATMRYQISKWKAVTSPAPHVILLTIRCDVKYTSEEYAIYRQIKEAWCDDKEFCQRLMVAFTFGDTLDKTIEQVLPGVGPDLQSVLKDAGHRYVVVNPQADLRTRQAAVSKVLDFMTHLAHQPASLHQQRAQAFPGNLMETTTIPTPVPDNEGRVLIIGKTGNGKSTLGNLLLDSKRFQVGAGMSSRTSGLEIAETSIGHKRSLKVVDTPDLLNLGIKAAEIPQEIARWKAVTSSAPYVILLTVRCDVKYTSEEYAIYRQIKEAWCDDREFCQRLMVAFTFGDTLDKTIEQVLPGVGPDLQSVLKDAGHRYVVVNPQADLRTRQAAVSKVLDFMAHLAHQPASLHQQPAQAFPGNLMETTTIPTPVPDNEGRVLIIGKTGNGKSTLGNLLLDSKRFQVGAGMSSRTSGLEIAETSIGHKRSLKVVDTPDLLNLGIKAAEIPQEIARWKAVTSSAPYVILLTVRCDVKYTSEEYAIYRQIKEAWCDDREFCQRLMVAFTFGDTLDKTIEQVLPGVGPDLQSVLKDAGHRYVVVNPQADLRTRQAAVSKVLDFMAHLAHQPASLHQQPAQAFPGNLMEKTTIPTPVPDNEGRVLIIGKTGNGKSTLGNLLLDSKRFQVGAGMSSRTSGLEIAETSIGHKRSLKVVDTPDLLNLGIKAADIPQEIARWKAVTSSAPYVILLTVRCDVKYTSEEYAIYRQIKEAWCDDREFCQRLMVAFTFGDTLDKTIEQVLPGVGPDLQSVLKDAGHRYVVVNPQADLRTRQAAVSKVLDFMAHLGHRGNTPSNSRDAPMDVQTSV